MALQRPQPISVSIRDSENPNRVLTLSGSNMLLEISVFEVLRATLALKGDRIVTAVRTAVETSMSSPDAFEVSPGLQRRLGIAHLGYCFAVPELLLVVKPRVQGGCLLRLVVFLKKQPPIDVNLIVTSRPN